ncbi:MAG: molybdopterin-dependent oxidoreductase [Deltaproteobacteria bacterium]
MINSKPESEAVKSVCPYCGVGCGVIFETRKGKVVKVKGDAEHPANFGRLCTKGASLHKTIHTRDRLMKPLMRRTRDEALIPVSWDAALGRIADKFHSLIADYGPESIAFYISGQLMTEDYYVVNKLTKGFLKVNNLDSNSRLCMSSAVMGYRRAFGVDAPPCSYEDFEHSDCIFIIGSNTAYCHPVLFMRISEIKAQKGDKLKIIVADPRRTPTAAIADLYLPLAPGTDVPLVNSMIHVLMKEGIINRSYISANTEGFAELERIVEEYSPEKVSEICKIPPFAIREAALMYAKAGAALTLWTMGLNQSAQGTDKNNAVINLSLATGNIGRPGAGPFSLTGQANAMGGRETGGLANLLPGHRYMDNPLHRDEVSAFWGGGDMREKRGQTAVELFDGVDRGVVKAIWIICTNPVVSLPNGSKVERALSKAELVVVQDLFRPTDTGMFADVLLPAAGFSEKEGTMTNSERRISYVGKAVEPPGEATPDWQIFTRFARKMGYSEFFPYESPEEVFEEYKKLTRGRDMDISGVSYGRLQSTGPVQWPCPDENHPGTQRLYTDGRFETESKRAKFIPVKFIPPVEGTDSAYPLTLTTGRLRDQWHTMTKTGKVEALTLKDPYPVLEVHPSDAGALGIKEGDLVKVESRRGEATVQAAVTDKVKEGCVFMPFHWGKLLADNGRANLLTIEALDPFSRQPEFKACAVRVEKKIFAQSPKIAVVGNDPAGLRVIETLIEMNPNAEVSLFSTEHVDKSLPEGVARYAELPLRIDPDKRKIFMKGGAAYTYESLVLASGSRYSIPPVAGMNREGVIIVENLPQLKRAIGKMLVLKKALVLGEGALGLEIADYMRSRGAEVEFINPSNVLLEKQLDGSASEMLYYELKRKGISVKLGAEVDAILGNGKATGVQLEDGDFRAGDVVVIEARLRANVDVASRMGVMVNKGILVGEKLETAMPNVYAVGTAAEFRGVVSADADVIAEQAHVLGRILAGDPTARFAGTLGCNRLRALNYEIISFGEFNADDDEANVLAYLDKAQSVYKKVVIRDNRILGGLFFRDTTSAEEIIELARKKADISGLRRNLLSGNLKGRVAKGKILCSCAGVTEEEIQIGIKNGMGVEDLGRNYRVGVNCGACLTEVRELIKAHRSRH